MSPVAGQQNVVVIRLRAGTVQHRPRVGQSVADVGLRDQPAKDSVDRRLNRVGDVRRRHRREPEDVRSNVAVDHHAHGDGPIMRNDARVVEAIQDSCFLQIQLGLADAR